MFKAFISVIRKLKLNIRLIRRPKIRIMTWPTIKSKITTTRQLTIFFGFIFSFIFDFKFFKRF